MKRQLVEAHAEEKRYRLQAKRFEDETVKARKEVDRLTIKVNSISSGSVNTREIDLEQKYEKCMVCYYSLDVSARDIYKL
jgi:E3 ubiquitin-protein ligase BRE1